MILRTIAIIILILGPLLSCKEEASSLAIPEPEKQAYGPDSLSLNATDYNDRILGALVGSAIGDAMGASTEMWYRADIQRKYGYITGLTPAVRDQSPEGTWEHNLSAGATTDDTRWKFLLVKYLTAHSEGMTARHFADFITEYYQEVAGGLADKAVTDNPDELGGRLEKVDWILEWARVSKAFNESPEAYVKALNRFYGGEMACAGMLYTPMFGLVAPNAGEAYEQAYEHSLFDHGYARDISALLAGMSNMALQGSSIDSILDVSVYIDPQRFQDSRLVGRISLDIAGASRRSVDLAREMGEATATADSVPPTGYPGTPIEWTRQAYLYSFLEQNQKAIPFHAGEIWQILITGLAWGGGDFDKTMQFIINYGRDNDTVGAVAGMILGAKLGFSGLPQGMRKEVLKVNRDQLGIDLEKLAAELIETSPALD